jgi:hypothetical protein
MSLQAKELAMKVRPYSYLLIVVAAIMLVSLVGLGWALRGSLSQPGQPLDPGDNLLVIHTVDGAGLHTEQVYNLAVGARPLYLPLVLQRP